MLGALVLLAGQIAAPAPVLLRGADEIRWAAPAQTTLPPLPLSTVIARVRTSSPRVRSAQLLSDAWREAAPWAGRLTNPFIDVRTENLGAPASAGTDVFIEVTQPLELGGRRRLRQQLANAESAGTATALQTTERALALESARAYVRALRARALLDTLGTNRSGLALMVTSVTRQVEDGYTAEADLLKFKTEAARIDVDIARARLELERSLSALGTLIGMETPIQPTQLVEPEALSVPSADPAQIAIRLAQRPEVLAATASVARSRVALEYERARALPDAAVTAGYKRTGGFDTGVVGMTMALPLFDRNRAAVARAAGVERAATAERDALVAQLTAEASSLVRAARTIAQQASSAEVELLAPAEGVRRAALAAFREKTADVLKLIDAERVYADVHRATIDLRLDALLTTIEARFALGEESIP